MPFALLVLIAALPLGAVQCEGTALGLLHRDGFEAWPSASGVAQGRICRVSPEGDDAGDGSAQSPFRSVQRCAEVAEPGDTCLIAAGVYRERVRPARSGTDGAPIRFEAEPAARVLITGAEPLADWRSEGDGLYSAAMASPLPVQDDSAFTANQVFADGRMLPEARHPNGGLDPMQPGPAGGGVSFVDGRLVLARDQVPEIPGGWQGAILWGTEWFVSRTGRVVDATSVGLEVAPTDSSSWNRAPFWWTLTGARGALDAAGEWYFEAAEQRLYLRPLDAGPPVGVEYKRRGLAFDLRGLHHIEISGLNLFASRIVSDAQSRHLRLDRLDATYLSHYLTLPDLPADQIAPGTDGFALIGSHIHDSGIELRGYGHVLSNSRLRVSAGNLVLLAGEGHRVENSVLEDANYLSSYAASLQVSGSGHRILRNTLRRAGRSAINVDWKLSGFSARDIEIAYNDFSEFGLLSTDLGAIYVCCYTDLAGTRIHHNVIRDARGFSPFWGTRGIYFDIESGFNATVDHNLVYGLVWSSDNLNAAIGSDRGATGVFHNTFVGPSALGAGVEARNNVFVVDTAIGAPVASSNLFAPVDPRFVDPQSALYQLLPDSPARDAGVLLPGINDDFEGPAPDLGAFEFGRPAWRAGAEWPAPSR